MMLLLLFGQASFVFADSKAEIYGEDLQIAAGEAKKIPIQIQGNAGVM